jgi:plastocyanin
MKPPKTLRPALILAAAAVLVSCTSEAPAKPDDTSGAVQATEVAQPAASGRVIEVKMITDDKGNYFEPSKIEAHPGDILRFTLVSGVHNVNFLAEKNQGLAGLPPASEMLQLPGQTYELQVTLAPGKYYFQCDPHALLGMVGELEVEDEDEKGEHS